MKALNLEIEDSLYPALLELLKNLPSHKIKIQEVPPKTDNSMNFEQAMEYTLDKNQELYKRLS